MGTWLPSARNRESTVSPSMSGSMMSSTTTSGSYSRMTLSARCPSEATFTSHPSYRRAIASNSVSEFSSSTTTARTGDPSAWASEGMAVAAGMLPILRRFL
jgi:hypothetical protein